jgi:choline dehydrogenase-like flavoprotein
MIISSRDLAPANLENIDVCIVGAGAAGITLACELDGCGLKVTLLEAGGFKPEYDSLDFYRGTAVQPHPDPTEYRRSAFGGTTKLWGGRCVALEPIDFERRAYVSHSGWPLAFAEVAQYYPRALTDSMAMVSCSPTALSATACLPTSEGATANGSRVRQMSPQYCTHDVCVCINAQATMPSSPWRSSIVPASAGV